MNNTSGKVDHVGGGNTIVALEPFPGEEPTRKALGDWLDRSGPVLKRAGFGPAMRGETPPHLIAYSEFCETCEVPELTEDQRASMGPAESTKYDLMRSKHLRENRLGLARYHAELTEYHNKLAAILESSLRHSAGLRLKSLLKKHAVADRKDVYHGGRMWRDLVSLMGDACRLDEARVHDRAFEEARDNYLPDGCSAQAYADKVNVLMREHLRWMERPLKGAALGTFLIKLMPLCNAAEGRALCRELSADDKLKDTTLVIQRCTEVVRDSACPDNVVSDKPVGQMTQTDYAALLKKLLEAGVGADALANLTKAGSGKTGQSKNARKKEERRGKSRLEPGKLCKSGTCNFNHDETAPGEPCFRSALFKGPLPPRYANNPQQVARIEAARMEHAKKLGIPYQPLPPPKPASALVPVGTYEADYDDETLDGLDYNNVLVMPAAALLTFDEEDSDDQVSPPAHEYKTRRSYGTDAYDRVPPPPPSPVPFALADYDNKSIGVGSALPSSPASTEDSVCDWIRRDTLAQWDSASDASSVSDEGVAAPDVSPPAPTIAPARAPALMPRHLSLPPAVSPSRTLTPRQLAPLEVSPLVESKSPAGAVAEFRREDSNGVDMLDCPPEAPEAPCGADAAAVDPTSVAPPSPRSWLAALARVAVGLLVLFVTVCALVGSTSALDAPRLFAAAGPLALGHCAATCSGPPGECGPWAAAVCERPIVAHVARSALSMAALRFASSIVCRAACGAYHWVTAATATLFQVVAGVLRAAGARARAAAVFVGGCAQSAMCEVARGLLHFVVFALLLSWLSPSHQAVVPAGSRLGVMRGRALEGLPAFALGDAASATCLSPQDCARLGLTLGLSPEEVAPTILGVSALRPRALHLADSGAAVHAINDERYMLPGTRRPNRTVISTANGAAMPEHRCDAVIRVRAADGEVRTEGALGG